MSRPGPGQDVGEELLDFEVQSPVKLEEGSPEHANCGEVAATKVTGGHACGDKIEPGADHLEDGEVKVESQGNLEDGEISEEEGGGQAGHGQVELNKRRVCRHFAAGRTCMWGQNCRFLHPKKGCEWGNYSMFPSPSPVKAAVVVGTKLGPVKSQEVSQLGFCSYVSGGGGVHSKAWEEGLAKARQLRKISKKRRLEDFDYEEKRDGLSTMQVELQEEADYCAVVRVEPTTVEDDEDLEDLVFGQKESEENTAWGCRVKSQGVKIGGYVEAMKRIEDIEKELKGVEGQILIKKRKFSS